MTVGKPDYNLDSFGIKYVKKDTKPTGSTPSTTKTPHGLDAPKDKLDLGGNNPTNSANVDTTTSYGEGSSGAQHGGKTTQGEGKNQGDKAEMTGIGGTRKNPNSNAQGNQVNFKKPEGETLPKNASLELAIIKCKLLKAGSALKKGLSGDTNFKRETLQESSENYLKEPKKESVDDSAKEYLKEKDDHDDTGSPKKEKLNSRNQRPLDPDSDDDRSFGEIRSQSEAKEKSVRELAIDAIDIAMKNIAEYQDNKEKALQEELIKEAHEAQKEGGMANTSDGVNAVYSDVKQKPIKKE
tara:strand:+ start:72 stop:959 length:888 start_codon:yes stop_codon:yes gene_type:complete